MATKVPEFPKPSLPVLRSMGFGQTVVFRASPSAPRVVTAAASKIGGKFRMKTVCIVDPVECTGQKVLLVTCCKAPRD